MDISFVEVEVGAEEPVPPTPPSAWVSLSFQPTGVDGRPTSARASFDEWGSAAPMVTLGSDIVLPAISEPNGATHHHGMYDTLAFDAAAELESIAFTPPRAPAEAPIVVGLPTMHPVSGLSVCPDSAGLVHLGMRVQGATPDAEILWQLVVVGFDPSGEILHRVSWNGRGQPVRDLASAALPAGDTLSAALSVAIFQQVIVDDSVRVDTSTDLLERYDIVVDGSC